MFWMFRLIVNPFVGVLVLARTKLIGLGGVKCQVKNGKIYESSIEHQNVSYKFSGYLHQRPFISVGINIRCVEHRILCKTGKTAPHRMKLSQYLLIICK